MVFFIREDGYRGQRTCRSSSQPQFHRKVGKFKRSKYCSFCQNKPKSRTSYFSIILLSDRGPNNIRSTQAAGSQGHDGLGTPDSIAGNQRSSTWETKIGRASWRERTKNTAYGEAR